MAAHIPLVSIITAVRNGMPFLADNLESVASQTYPAIEHWLIDGGSTDGTLHVIRTWQTSLTGWVSEPDCGIADAFNKGLARARGEYIMFLNADDALAAPSAISALITAARASNWPDVLYGDCDLVDRQTGKFLYRHAGVQPSPIFALFDSPASQHADAPALFRALWPVRHLLSYRHGL